MLFNGIDKVINFFEPAEHVFIHYFGACPNHESGAEDLERRCFWEFFHVLAKHTSLTPILDDRRKQLEFLSSSD